MIINKTVIREKVHKSFIQKSCAELSNEYSPTLYNASPNVINKNVRIKLNFKNSCNRKSTNSKFISSAETTSSKLGLSRSHSNLNITKGCEDFKYTYERQKFLDTKTDIGNERVSKFVSKILKVIKYERKLEKARITINKRKDFDPLLLFSFFDKYERAPLAPKNFNTPTAKYDSKQYLDIHKLKSSFKKLGISLSSSRLKKFFRRYNSSNDDKLTLHEFLDIFIPRELDPKYFKLANEALVQEVKNFKHIEHFVSLDTLFKIRDFILYHIKIDKVIEKALSEMKNIPSFEVLSDLKQAKIDDLTEPLSIEGITDVIKKYGFKVKQNEVLLLINRINSIVKDSVTYIDLAGNRVLC
mmetsp:Transcript_8881/g.7860  ORF Transcript_8881/g.7860 Transcript_8881/m.7860 type:complete len:356 (-) Transcript_8881:124-1191(-)